MGRRALILGLLSVSGCDPSSETSHSPLTTHQISIVDAVARYGSLTDGNEMFSWIADAGLSSSGRFVVILDGAPPFIHVFDRIAEESWIFGPAGDGPGELRRPYSLEVVGDTAVLVLNGAHIDLFDIEGLWKRRRPLQDFGLLASALAVGCNGRFFIYGVPVNGRYSSPVQWLHEVQWDSVPRRRPLLEAPGIAREVRLGGSEGLDATDDGILLWHRNESTRAGWWLPCSTLEPQRLTDRSSGTNPVEQRRIDSERTVARTFISHSDTIFHGAAISGATGIFSFMWWDKDSERTTLEFRTPDTCASAQLAGHWKLLDASPSEVLLGHTDLFPEGWIVSKQLLSGWAEDSRCTS